MLVDWWSVFAQLLNFLLLVWLLNRYLFRPVLRMVEQRDQKIRKELEEASSIREQSLRDKESLFQEKETFHKEQSGLYDQAVFEAQKEKKRLLLEAKEEYEQLRLSLKEKLLKEQEAIFAEIGKKIEREVLDLLQKALQSIAHSGLEEQIVKIFLQKMKGMEEESKESLLSDLKRFPQTFQLKSSFELSPSTRLMLSQELSKILGTHYSLSFEKDAALLCGVELVTSGHRVGWNFSSYLSSMSDLL